MMPPAAPIASATLRPCVRACAETPEGKRRRERLKGALKDAVRGEMTLVREALERFVAQHRAAAASIKGAPKAAREAIRDVQEIAEEARLGWSECEYDEHDEHEEGAQPPPTPDGGR